LANVYTHPTFEECLERLDPARLFAVETGGSACYSDTRFQSSDALLFGPETRGLPPAALAKVPVGQLLHIPMRAGIRSLNLSNAVALVIYEAWRQLGFSQTQV
jgi:tRNA (cytidine/uridine-2'-O-)-methyltransferase